MKLKPGQSLVSAVDATTVIVIRCPDAELEVTCGGVAMTEPGAAADKQPGDPGQQDGALLGKRYADEELGIELLCTKGGEGTLAVNGRPLPIKESKPLPASD